MRVVCFGVLGGHMGLFSLFRDGHERNSIGDFVIDYDVLLLLG